MAPRRLFATFGHGLDIAEVGESDGGRRDLVDELDYDIDQQRQEE
jgi:hypothetical protein